MVCRKKRMRGFVMKKLSRIGVAILAASVALTGAYKYRSHRLQKGLAEEILRFHVIANSNSQKDQELKLKVRDKIGEYLGKELENLETLEECEQAVKENLVRIEDCAREVIEEEGYDYKAEAMVKEVDFPKKTYGNYTFPEGNYRALRVVIGKGEGENWWCVMYPNLCFSGSVYEVADENSKKELQAVLTEEEYAEIMAEGEIKVRFKYLEAVLKKLGIAR